MAEVRWGGYEGVYADRAIPALSPRVIGTMNLSTTEEGAARLITGTAHGRPLVLPRHTICQ